MDGWQEVRGASRRASQDQLLMREDGAMVDKIVITTSGQLPQDKGPEESPRDGGDIVETP